MEGVKNKSKIVTSNQVSIHDNLEKVVRRHLLGSNQKPLPSYSRDIFDKVIKECALWDKVILDIGCGVGQSTYELSQVFPEHLVIGIDKSEDRIERKNFFKKNLPKNCLIIRADIIDLWPLFCEFQKEDRKITHQFIFYPNPYPKSTHLKKRWHGHNSFKYLVGINSYVELRTNWKIYAQEFKEAYSIADKSKTIKMNSYETKKMMTPFEKKYLESGHELFQVRRGDI